jgi:hypothetical protein
MMRVVDNQKRSVHIPSPQVLPCLKFSRPHVLPDACVCVPSCVYTRIGTASFVHVMRGLGYIQRLVLDSFERIERREYIPPHISRHCMDLFMTSDLIHTLEPKLSLAITKTFQTGRPYPSL